MALAGLGLIDEYEFMVHTGIAGHGPTFFAGLSEAIEQSGVVAVRYEARARVT